MRGRKRPAGRKSLRLPCEWKVIALRECPAPKRMILMRGPGDAVAYWRWHIARSPHFSPECESAAVIILNARMRMSGHHLVSTGSVNQVVAEPREVFRAAVIAGACGVILMHNHPSGECDPSSADTQITRNLRAAGNILHIALVDHIIIGRGDYYSFAEHNAL